MLELKGVSTAYGQIEVLREIDISVEQGEIVALIGANGAGKSTTLMTISGVNPAKTGTIEFNGVKINGLAPDKIVALGLCQVPEGRRIFPRLTVEENLEMGSFLLRDQRRIKTNKERAYDLFPILGERKGQLGGTLSGGEQQMLAIARALMGEPKLLLLDEPSLGLAPIIVSKIFSTIGDINKEGMTVLLVEQNAHAALRLAHRAYVLETGRVTAFGPAEELRKDERIRKAYLGE